MNGDVGRLRSLGELGKIANSPLLGPVENLEDLEKLEFFELFQGGGDPPLSIYTRWPESQPLEAAKWVKCIEIPECSQRI